MAALDFLLATPFPVLLILAGAAGLAFSGRGREAVLAAGGAIAGLGMILAGGIAGILLVLLLFWLF